MGLKIQRPDIAVAIQKLLRLTGSIDLEVEEFILQTIQVGDLSHGQLPPVSLHASADFVIGAVVAEHAIWRMEIPGSAIARVTRIIVRPGTDTTLRVHFGSTLAAAAFPTAVTNKGFTDGRVLFGVGDGNVPLPAVSINTGTQVASMPREYSQFFGNLQDQLILEPHGWIVGTGDPNQFGFIEFQVTNLNEQMIITMEWDEWRIS